MSTFSTPAEVCNKVKDISRQKASASFRYLAVMGVLAGIYIGFGAELSTLVTCDSAKYLGLGFSKFLAGSVFSVGLMLVVICGAELFTGNCLMFGPAAERCTNTRGMLRNWIIVYFANFAGSLLLAVIMYYTGLWKLGGCGVGVNALSIANAKVNLSFAEAFFRGICCNWLVCLAVWLALASQDVVGKVLGIYFPIMAFVASGFEHSIANMYFIPIGLFLKGNEAVMAASGIANLDQLTWGGFLLNNLVPVTLGNIVGGGIFVSCAYCLAFYTPRNK